MPAFAMFLLLLSCLLISHPARSQPLITEAEVRASFGGLFQVGCGIDIPVGEYEFPLPEASPGGARHDFVITLKALDQIGAVRITHHAGLIGFARFRVDVSPNIDRDDYYEQANRKCIRNFKTPPILNFLKIEPVKGGRTNWSGAIASFTVTMDRTELLKRYIAAANVRVNSSPMKSRALYSYDIFQKKWVWLASEYAALDAPFTSSSISEALKRD